MIANLLACQDKLYKHTSVFLQSAPYIFGFLCHTIPQISSLFLLRSNPVGGVLLPSFWSSAAAVGALWHLHLCRPHPRLALHDLGVEAIAGGEAFCNATELDQWDAWREEGLCSWKQPSLFVVFCCWKWRKTKNTCLLLVSCTVDNSRMAEPFDRWVLLT